MFFLSYKSFNLVFGAHFLSNNIGVNKSKMKMNKIFFRDWKMGSDDPDRICSKCLKDIGDARAMKAKEKLYHADSW